MRSQQRRAKFGQALRENWGGQKKKGEGGKGARAVVVHGEVAEKILGLFDSSDDDQEVRAFSSAGNRSGCPTIGRRQE
jgi:hypothetical protein